MSSQLIHVEQSYDEDNVVDRGLWVSALFLGGVKPSVHAVSLQ